MVKLPGVDDTKPNDHDGNLEWENERVVWEKTTRRIPVNGLLVENYFTGVRLTHIGNTLKGILPSGEVYSLLHDGDTLLAHSLYGVITTPMALHYCGTGDFRLKIAERQYLPEPTGEPGDVYTWGRVGMAIHHGTMTGRNILTGQTHTRPVWTDFRNKDVHKERRSETELENRVAIGHVDVTTNWVFDDFTIFHHGEWELTNITPSRQSANVVVKGMIFHNQEKNLWQIGGQWYRWRGGFHPVDERGIGGSVFSACLTFSTPWGTREITLA